MNMKKTITIGIASIIAFSTIATTAMVSVGAFDQTY